VLLFALRKVDEQQLIAQAGAGLPLAKKRPAAGKVLDDGGLSELFGLELAKDAPPVAAAAGKQAKPGRGKTPTASTSKAARAEKRKTRSRSHASAGPPRSARHGMRRRSRSREGKGGAAVRG
jgi:hypothetical protein